METLQSAERDGMPGEPSRHPEEAPRGVPLNSGAPGAQMHQVVQEFSLERYKYILQQIHATNENVYKFLAIYQALATATVGAALALFVGYRGWGLPPATVRTGVLGLIWLETVIAGFTILLIFIGILAWLDYRSEECELTDKVVHKGFRKTPRVRNFFRWYETYIIAFITASTAFLWFFTLTLVLPAIK